MQERPKTEAEHLQELVNDPSGSKMPTDRQRELARVFAERAADQWPIVCELRAIGRNVDSIWWFVNTAESYPDAIPILHRHLTIEHILSTYEGLSRALTVKEARGIVCRTVLDIFKRRMENHQFDDSGIAPAGGELYREYSFVRTLVSNLTVTADRSVSEELKQMHTDPKYKPFWKLLGQAYRKSLKK
jgi:hypothetical protein